MSTSSTSSTSSSSGFRIAAVSSPGVFTAMPSASVWVCSAGTGSPRKRARIDGHIEVCTP